MAGQTNPSRACTRYVLVLGRVNRLEAALDENGVHSVCDELEQWKNSPRKSRRRKIYDLDQVLSDFGNDPLSMLKRDINYLGNKIGRASCRERVCVPV